MLKQILSVVYIFCLFACGFNHRVVLSNVIVTRRLKHCGNDSTVFSINLWSNNIYIRVKCVLLALIVDLRLHCFLLQNQATLNDDLLFMCLTSEVERHRNETRFKLPRLICEHYYILIYVSG